jgi:hypothetical protein
MLAPFVSDPTVSTLVGEPDGVGNNKRKRFYADRLTEGGV